MGLFTTAGIAAIEHKDRQVHVRVTIAGENIPRGKIHSYGYSSNKDFASDQASVVLDNRDGEYAPAKKDWYNAEIIIYLGILAGGKVEWKKVFTGLVRQHEVSHSGTMHVVNLTAFDYLIRLQELETEERFEAPKTKITLETPTVNWIAFSATISGTPSATSVTYTSVLSESTLSAGDTLYNASDSYSERTVVSVDTTNDIITTTSKSDSWADGDTIVKSTRVQVLDLANSNVATFPEPVIKIKNRDDELEDPLWDGFQVLYEQGQILLGRPINWAEYLIRVTYYYYPTATALYVEDVVEDVLTELDGYSNAVFTIADNLTQNFLAMTNKTIDTLKPNSVIETIDEVAYDIGQIWYLSYSNVLSTLTSSDFTIPSGSTIDTISTRYGRIILDAAIATTSTVTYNKNYNFNTLQASGIQFSKIDFTYETIENRLEALNSLRTLMAPNYIYQTRGTNKIWGRYLYQKDTADYTLKNKLNLSFAEDLEVYTRVRLFGQNSNPQNLLFDSDVTVVQDTDEYYGSVTNQELTFTEESGGWRIYSTGLGEAARIIPTHDGVDTWPVVYINNVPIDNQAHEMLMQPVETKRRETYSSECSSWCTGQKIRSFRKYWIYFSHSSIAPTQPVYLYNSSGVLVKTLSAYDSYMNYGEGYWFRDVGEGDAAWVSSLSTASYYINFSLGKMEVLWDQGKFKVHSTLFGVQRADIVSATFTYSAIYQAPGGIDLLIDGRFTTQVQTEFTSKPAAGFTWAIIDLGEVQEIDAIDLIGGFYYPDQNSLSRKFNTEGWFTIEYSPDDVDSSLANFYVLCAEANNFKLGGGESKSWERDELGDDFQARYIKIKIEDLEKISYGDEGKYVVAFSELAIYKNVVLTAQAYLTATLADEDDNHLYDTDGLLAKIGDKLYKETSINQNLSNLTSLKRFAKALLREYTKNHDKLTATSAYGPHFEVGQTLRVIDTSNEIDQKYFVEALANNNGQVSLTLARYPRYTVLGGQDPGVVE